MESNKIYDEINIKIKSLTQEISNEKIESEEIEEAKKNVQKMLDELQNKLNVEIEELKKNSEWDIFTIAFYGETNAGKSTLIETLRILLNEKTKVEIRNKFWKIESVINQINEEKFKINNQIKKINLEILEIKEKIVENLRNKEQCIIHQKKLDVIIKSLNKIDIKYDNEIDSLSIRNNDDGNVLENIYSTNNIKINFEKVKENNNIAIENILKENLKKNKRIKENYEKARIKIKQNYNTKAKEIENNYDNNITKIKESYNIAIKKIKENHSKLIEEYNETIEQLKIKLEEKINKRNFLLKFLYFLLKKRYKEEILIQEKKEKLNEENKIKEKIIIDQDGEKKIKLNSEFENKKELVTKLNNKKKHLLIEIKEKKEELINRQKKNEKELISNLENTKRIKINELIKNEKIYINNKSQEYTEELEKCINEIENIDKLIEKSERNLELKNSTSTELEKRKKTLEIELPKKEEELNTYQDGEIIGDGSPDFTRESTEYDFEVDNQKFSIIDLPGIEGNEKDVLKSIKKYLQKAHTVFYMTRKPTPPQTGDKEKGTLEKIKEQLGSQTDIKAIYNKSINNIRQLNNELTSEDEGNSLKDMDEKLKEILKEHYKGSLVISAKPSYLAVSECLVPNNADYKKRKYFLEKFSKEELLDKSGMKNFVNSLCKETVSNYREKIKKSNFQKVKYTLGETINKIDERQRDLEKIAQKFKYQTDNSIVQINDNVNELENSFNIIKSQVIENFINDSTAQIHNYIELDNSNTDVKNKLEEIIKNTEKRTKVEFGDKMRKSTDEFQQNIEEITKNLRHYLKNILLFDYQYKINDTDFDINFKIDSGIKISKLLSAICNGILLFVTRNCLIVINIIFDLFNATASAFSKKYKKAQQRKNVDKIIYDISIKLDETVGENLSKLMIEINSKMKDIINQLEIPLNQINHINKKVLLTSEELKKLKKKIE